MKPACSVCSKDEGRLKGMCRPCYAKVAFKAYYEKNKASLNRKRAEYRKTPAGQATEVRAHKKYHATHRATSNARSRNYYQQHRKQALAKSKEYLATVDLEKKRLWQKRTRQNAVNTPEKRAAYNARMNVWKKEHPESNRSQASKRRAMMRGCEAEPVSYKEIWEKSNKMCGLCGKRVAFKDRTLDHIVPIARGGAHKAVNLQVAHFRCNASRGAGRIPAQIKMIA